MEVKMLLKSTEPISRSDLGLYLRVISMKYPNVQDYHKLAILIEEEFGVRCTDDDIVDYYCVYLEFEDKLLQMRHCGYGY